MMFSFENDGLLSSVYQNHQDAFTQLFTLLASKQTTELVVNR